MGVPNLLPFVAKACRDGNLEEFRGKRIAIDASCLLHGGIRINPKTGEVIERSYIHYVHKHLDLLLKLKCHIVLVFDGQPLPAKKGVNDARKKKREASRKKAQEFMRQGLYKQAMDAFQKSVGITPDIVKKTIEALRNMKDVDSIVAPYEADAQLAYLMQENLVDAVVTVDSDLIVFGCTTIIYNLNPCGTCKIYERSKLRNCLLPALNKRFEFDVFRWICILNGCDYLQGGLFGIGLDKAQNFFARTTQTDIRKLLPKLPQYMNMSKVVVDKAFVDSFMRAEKTFLHQVIFDPILKVQKHLNPSPNVPEADVNDSIDLNDSTDVELMDYVGKIAPTGEALRRALGNLVDDVTAPMQDDYLLPLDIPRSSIWNADCHAFIAEKKEKRKRELEDKLGAFQASSPKKRRICSDANTEQATGLTDERQEDAMRRTEAILIRNGSFSKWNSDDWIRIYGVGIRVCASSSIGESPNHPSDVASENPWSIVGRRGPANLISSAKEHEGTNNSQKPQKESPYFAQFRRVAVAKML